MRFEIGQRKLFCCPIYKQPQNKKLSTVNRGVFTQNLKFEYLYKNQCKSGELLWALYDMVPLISPQQIVGFAVTLVEIFIL
jgi:hypothetical protein